MDAYPLLVIVGPTGSGKTALSLALAREWPAEIVSCDSVAVYEEFELGTAKPPREERVAVPHHLLDVVAPTAAFTAGDYLRRGRTALAEIRERGRLPIVVGGTGFYLRALLHGLFAGPARSEELRERLRRGAARNRPGHLHRVLQRLDPAAAARIHANDHAKLGRAIEVTVAGGEPISAAHARGRDPLTGFRVLTLGLDPERPALYARLNERCRRMFAAGLVAETAGLLGRYEQRGILEQPSHPINSLGYRQAVQHLREGLELEAAIAAAQQSHRHYAKRQRTWFRNIDAAATHWLPQFGDAADACPAARARLLAVPEFAALRQ